MLISDVLEKILMTAQFSVENKSSVWVAVHGYRDSKADFADCLIGLKNREEGCDKTITFDQSLKNLGTFQVL
ncbi:MAG: hypothetical protein HYY44_00580 [Deltaproteobacteria bacterium]|nr:hypothetical protein [Deltaproteobacteria bacterium]